MTVASGQGGADKRDTEIRALEAAAVAAVIKALQDRLDRITTALRDAFTSGDGARWLATRHVAARALRRIRPDTAALITPWLGKAAHLGAGHAGGALPDGYDPATVALVRDVLEKVDADITGRLNKAATELLTRPPKTLPQLTGVLDRIDSAAKTAQQATSTAIVGAVAGGAAATAAASGVDLTWWSERGACLSCASMAGSVAPPGGKFFPTENYAGNQIMPWLLDGVDHPPAHRACRCHAALATPGLATGLAREAAREVAKGQSLYDSLPARLRAVNAALRGSRLPASVRARAATDQRRGAFSQRQKPLAHTSTRRSR